MAVTSASEGLMLHYIRGWHYGKNIKKENHMVRKKAGGHGGRKSPGSFLKFKNKFLAALS